MRAAKRPFRRPALLLLAAFALAPVRAGAQCPEWIPTFGAPGVGGVNFTSVYAQAWFDDGSGSNLVVGGSFFVAGDVAAANVARWDGSAWHALGAGLDGQVYALAVFDDGSGPALYAAGQFFSSGSTPLSNIAKFDGTSWSSPGAGVGSLARVLQVFDDGSGPALYVGGEFQTAGGIPASRIARWDGTTWSALGAGVPSNVYSMATFAPAGSPELFVAPGGASFLYRWNGTTWNTLHTGIQSGLPCMLAFDDGTGEALYVGGGFGGVDGVPALHIARWDGSGWSAVGDGLGPAVGGAIPFAMAVHDAGSGPELFVGGGFTDSGGTPISYVAHWNGSAWLPAGGGTDYYVYSLSAHDGGGSEVLYAGGIFQEADGRPANSIASFQGGQWSRVSSSQGPAAPLESLLAFDDGSGPGLYAGGDFDVVGDIDAAHIARWDGAAWTALGSGVDGAGSPTVRALVRHDDGSGDALFVGGHFDVAGGAPAANVARWDGAAWTALGAGIAGEVDALVVHDDGSGPKLYVGGLITQAGGVPVSGIARWDGQSWSAVGGGIAGRVTCLASFDDGLGRALFAGGSFASAGGVAANHIARWRDGTWSALGSGLGQPAGAHAEALLVHDDGTGPALYVGGAFNTAGGTGARCIARWNGISWSPLGPGTLGAVLSLATFDLGAGPRLVAGGAFDFFGGLEANRIAAWDGASWSPIAGGAPQATVRALAAFDDGSTTDLYAGGAITAAGGLPAWNLARLHGCGLGMPGTDLCSPGVAGVEACPCGNPQVPAGDARGCNNSSGTGGARLTSSGHANLSADTVALVSSGERPTSLSIFLQGNALIPGGTTFGQGVRCVGGVLKRLYSRSASGGMVTAGYGVPSDLPVHERSAVLGDEILAGTARLYMVYYRDPAVLGGCPTTSTFNGTQAQRIVWSP